MKLRQFAVAAVSAGALAALSTSALAQAANAPAPDKKGENVARDAQRPDDLTVRQLHLAEELAAYGRQNKDALSLVVAAQIRKAVPVKFVDRKPENGDDASVAKAPEGDSVDAWLKEAREVSKNDKTIVALADEVKASATKGRVGGGVVSYGQITGNTTHNVRMSFHGGRFAEVALAGVSSPLFVLEIRDENGNMICRDAAPAYCSFNPIWTGPFTVKVVNVGRGLAHYKLATN